MPSNEDIGMSREMSPKIDFLTSGDNVLVETRASNRSTQEITVLNRYTLL